MSLPSCCWRLPVLSLCVLGGQGCGALGDGGAERGVRDSISCHSSSLRHLHHPGFILFPLHQGESSGGGDSGGGGACVPLSGVLQLHVCGYEVVRRVKAHYRPLHPESLGSCIEIPDGDCPVGSPFSVEERLDGHHRSEGHLPSDSGSPSESEVSEVYGRGESLAVKGSLLWPVHGAAGIYPV